MRNFEPVLGKGDRDPEHGVRTNLSAESSLNRLKDIRDCPVFRWFDAAKEANGFTKLKSKRRVA